MSRGRGRGRGRIRFGGSHDTMLADLLDETREDLGLSHAQMEQLAASNGSALYPPIALPPPGKLSERDIYLIHKQRVLAHELENLYSDSWQDGNPNAPTPRSSEPPTTNVHVTVPDIKKPNEIYIPDELVSNSISGGRAGIGPNGIKRSVMKPRAFESVFKNLEDKEKKLSEKSSAAANEEADDDNADEEDEDLGDDMNDYTFDYYDSDAQSDEGDEEVFF